MKLINRNTSKGSSLIEVMVALFVLAVGLLGILAMQTRSVQLSQNAYLYTRATILANDLLESIQLSGEPIGAFTGAATAAVDCVAATCTPEQYADWSLARWQQRVADSLPGGVGRVEGVTGASHFQIVVEFADSSILNEAGDDLEPQSVRIEIGS